MAITGSDFRHFGAYSFLIANFHMHQFVAPKIKLLNALAMHGNKRHDRMQHV